MLNNGAWCLMASIGHRTGLFDIMSGLPPATVADIARAARLNEGGEGLGAMWGEEKTREYLTKAGFKSIEKYELPHDPMNNWYVVRKSEHSGAEVLQR